MILSHKLKCIFVHVPKCAGTSVVRTLTEQGVLGSDDIVIGCTKAGEQIERDGGWNGLHKHSRASEIKKVVGEEIWSSYFTFSYVRNPWDRAISTYHWWCKTKYNGPDNKGDKVRSMSDFKEYVMSDLMYYDNSLDWTDDVEYVAKFEDIRKSFAYICGRLGIADLKMNKNNSTKHKHYSHYYDDETEDRIERIFSKDIDRFNYCFKREGPCV